jgi:xylulokinase
VSVFLGLDIGTSATKALLLEESGRIVSTASVEHPISRPREGWSEQHPADWWKSTVAAARKALEQGGAAGRSVGAIGLSGQMHGSVLLGPDAAGSGGRADPLRPAILWNDQRTAAECAEIEEALGGRRALVEACGNAALPGFTLPKLMWVRKHEPATWSQVGHLLLPKDFIVFRLTGALTTDVGDGAGTMLLDVDRRSWSERMLAASGVDRAILPRVLESAAVAGETTAWSAEQLGVRPGIPVVAGSGDNMCGAVGAGVVEPGMVLAALGTSGVIYVHTDRPRRDLPSEDPVGRLHCMCAATGPDGWCITGCMLSAGGALQWARDTIAPGERFDKLMAEAEGVPPGCEGLVFLPYLTGERCPHPDPKARGAWIGLTARHTRAHLIRAVVEGVTFGMGQILDLARSMGAQVNAVRITGGGNRSALWLQMQSDIYGVPVEIAGDDEGGSALGAAILAGSGTSPLGPVASACRHIVRVEHVVTPKSDQAMRYATARSCHAVLYSDLAKRFSELAEA